MPSDWSAEACRARVLARAAAKGWQEMEVPALRDAFVGGTERRWHDELRQYTTVAELQAILLALDGIALPPHLWPTTPAAPAPAAPAVLGQGEMPDERDEPDEQSHV